MFTLASVLHSVVTIESISRIHVSISIDSIDLLESLRKLNTRKLKIWPISSNLNQGRHALRLYIESMIIIPTVTYLIIRALQRSWFSRVQRRVATRVVYPVFRVRIK